MEAAPQTVVVVQQGPSRNATPKVIGIIAIIISSLSIIMTVLVGGLLALLSEGANELGAEISFLDQWGFILFYLPAAILLMVGGIKCLKYQKMGVFLMLGAEGLYALGNILILGGEELDIVSALMWPVIWAIVWALPLMLASGDLE